MDEKIPIFLKRLSNDIKKEKQLLETANFYFNEIINNLKYICDNINKIISEKPELSDIQLSYEDNETLPYFIFNINNWHYEIVKPRVILIGKEVRTPEIANTDIIAVSDIEVRLFRPSSSIPYVYHLLFDNEKIYELTLKSENPPKHTERFYRDIPEVNVKIISDFRKCIDRIVNAFNYEHTRLTRWEYIIEGKKYIVTLPSTIAVK